MALSTYLFRIAISALKFFVLDSSLLALFGFKVGVIAIFITSLFISYFMIVLYDYFKQDWFSIEYIKKERREIDAIRKSPQRLHERIGTVTKKEIYVFAVIIISVDAVVASLYFRKGNHLYNGITLIIWLLLICMTLASSFATAHILRGLYLFFMFLWSLIF